MIDILWYVFITCGICVMVAITSAVCVGLFCVIRDEYFK